MVFKVGLLKDIRLLEEKLININIRITKKGVRRYR